MCIRDRYQRRVHGDGYEETVNGLEVKVSALEDVLSKELDKRSRLTREAAALSDILLDLADRFDLARLPNDDFSDLARLREDIRRASDWIRNRSSAYQADLRNESFSINDVRERVQRSSQDLSLPGRIPKWSMDLKMGKVRPGERKANSYTRLDQHVAGLNAEEYKENNILFGLDKTNILSEVEMQHEITQNDDLLNILVTQAALIEESWLPKSIPVSPAVTRLSLIHI
eukprot:TRINITY_DN2738_c0_g1_i2.p1 TRINITY_DN2738_c0_g1~~TRINITY_DN2738_c0_g1_i2.p1  ORF type:complete len:249 (-),score=76.18 TRINITY_DN2738_c0_g1_i2:60-746(-)